MIVEIEGLRKVYESKQKVVAVDGIDLSVREGELYGLLGPNGAGKTTLLRLIASDLIPQRGSIARVGGLGTWPQA